MNSKRGVIMIGSQPPPVHGMSVVNAFMADKIEKSGCVPFKVDISATSLSRDYFSRVGRIKKILNGLIYAFSTRDSWSSLYISVSGGAGQIYEILFLILGRIFGDNIYIHHHSFAYLDRHANITRALTWVGGSDAVHIVLCTKMGHMLESQYKSVEKLFVLSNIVVCNAMARSPREESDVKTIGYLSNISREKGIYLYLDVVTRLIDKGLLVRGLIAGPFQDKRTELDVLAKINKVSGIDYIGRVDGEAKNDFFDNIDVLLFPTNYKNEAEPLCIYESLQHGVPIISTDRGCLEDMHPLSIGLVVGKNDDFVNAAEGQMLFWLEDDFSLKKVSENCFRKFNILRDKWIVQLNILVGMIVR